jgi:hypothetical protein
VYLRINYTMCGGMRGMGSAIALYFLGIPATAGFLSGFLMPKYGVGLGILAVGWAVYVGLGLALHQRGKDECHKTSRSLAQWAAVLAIPGFVFTASYTCASLTRWIVS